MSEGISEGISEETNGETSEETSEAIEVPEEDLNGYWWQGDLDNEHVMEIRIPERYYDLGVIVWTAARKDGKPVDSSNENFLEKMMAVNKAFNEARAASPPKHQFGSEQSAIEVLKLFPWNSGKFEDDLRRELIAYTNFKLGKGPNHSELSSKVAPVILPGMQAAQTFVGLFNQFSTVGESECGIEIEPDNKTAKYHQGKVILSADYSHEVEQRFGYGAKPEQVHELIKSDLQSNNMLSAEDALTGLYGLMRLIDSPSPSVPLSVNELLKLNGKEKLSAADKKTQIHKFEKIFRIFDKWSSYFELPQKWKDPDTGKMYDARIPGRMFIYEGPVITGQGSLPGMGNSNILGFILRHSVVSEQLRENKALLQIIQKSIKTIAQIPSGQPSGAWAKAMAMRLLFHSRNNRKNMGGTVTLKRETLLYGYKLDKDPETILNGSNPKRALEYWTTAISILKESGVIATIQEPPFPETKDGKKKTQGWQKEWVQQTVTIMMEGDLKESLDEVRDKYQKRSLKNPKKTSK